MSVTLRGIIHVHSDLSDDGFHSVADLAEFARQSGFQFVGMTDHAEDLSARDIQSLQEECIKSSDESFVMIPGLEFRCEGDAHILGIGVTEDIADRDPFVVATHIRDVGGVAILAHPGRSGYQFPHELYSVLDGIEIWNAGYDGRFVPRLANLGVIQQARTINPTVLGFGGADLHSLDQTPGVVLQLRQSGCGSVSRVTVLNNLRIGGFSICGRYVSVDANVPCHKLSTVYLWGFRKLYEISSTVRNRVLGES